MVLSEVTEGFIELLEDISHDPEQYDDYDLKQYIESVPNPYLVLKEFALYVHREYL